MATINPAKSKKENVTPNPQQAGQAEEPRRQKRWANIMHNGDQQRNIRGRAAPRPMPQKRKSNRSR